MKWASYVRTMCTTCNINNFPQTIISFVIHLNVLVKLNFANFSLVDENLGEVMLPHYKDKVTRNNLFTTIIY